MKMIYQIPETEIVLSELRNGIMQGEGTPEMSYPEIDNSGKLSNESTFDEGEINSGANTSLWED